MIPFVGPSYQLNTRKADVQRTVNMYVVVKEAPSGKSITYLKSAPGLAVFSEPDYFISEDTDTVFLMRGFDEINEYSSAHLARSSKTETGNSTIVSSTQSGFFFGDGITSSGTNGTYYIEFQNASGFMQGSSAFTLDFWWKPSAHGGVGGVNDRCLLLSLYQDTTLVVSVAANSTQLVYWTLAGYGSGITIPIGTRALASFQIASSTRAAWENGIHTGFTDGGSAPAFNKIRIGNDTGVQNTYGALEEIRISKVARYTPLVSFTPPTTYYP
jgi:hypothetical protein